jgi:urease accessory protein UreF
MGPEIARSEAANLLGEFSALLQQIGSPAGSALSYGSKPLSGLQAFLESYLSEILLPLELPAIAEACGHAMRAELRELVAQDQRLDAALRLTPFAAPSRQIGRLQLTRMRPLRDDRTVQRYLAAVESRQAHGWHTLVYGLTLAVYSLPLRQGLLYYAQETLSGLATAAAGEANDAESESSRIVAELMERVPAAVEASLLETSRNGHHAQTIRTTPGPAGQPETSSSPGV